MYGSNKNVKLMALLFSVFLNLVIKLHVCSQYRLYIKLYTCISLRRTKPFFTRLHVTPRT